VTKITECNLNLIVENKAININFRQSLRSNKIIIRDVFPKGFEVVYPSYCDVEKAKSFFIKQYEWICLNARQKPDLINIENGSVISLMGKEYIVAFTEKVRGTVEIIENKILIPGTSSNSKSKFRNYLKNKLLEYVRNEVIEFSYQLDKKVKTIKISDLKSRWGSCSSGGVLCFNLKLIFAPQAVIRYVVAHEVAHLVEMNHSERFWRIVNQLYPGYMMHREWLKSNGILLKKYLL
jgi:predicted metal-dependent hydrolase